jgi:predicted amidohydrolase
MPRKSIRAAAVQIKPDKNSVAKTIDHAISLLTKTTKHEPDLICLPEHWLPEQTIPAPISPLPQLLHFAEQYSVALVAGAYYEKVGGQIRLSSPVIATDGKLLGRQFKVHLFRRERKHARPGDTYNIFRLDHYNLGVLVCYDVDFPEPSRIYALKGAEVIACPSLIVKSGVKPWLDYLTVRCLENRMPVIAPNLYFPPYTDGHSTILTLEENARTHISYPKLNSLNRHVEGMVFSQIDLGFHNRLRKERFADRRPGTY